jgi:hypothetical protein
MFRLSCSVAVLAALTAGAAIRPALADQKSDCMRGIAMIKAELKKKHPDEVRGRLQEALTNAQNEVVENDWSECNDHINTARQALRK